ncbi:hypothetical protein QR680_014085 [Steinernema hermaphroditum]|uniref:C-type lectin domain-containing protein n=1 Tax=Steinernema hermaphroditum TaxID=289476 RepID=A0AA39I912_9BILA|nr:hypothetical protein QR680_014085 [Steinernema hermaphroditum]
MGPLAPLLLLALVATVSSYCPPGSLFSSNREKCITAVPVPLSYRNAQLSCGLFDGRLAKIENSDEYDLLFEHLSQKDAAGTQYWLGGTNINTTWVWLDGKKFSFSNWAVDEPANPEDENCLLVERETRLWKAEDCEKTAHYVCEMEPVVSLVDDDCPVTTPETCPPCPTCPPDVTCPPVTECPICPTTQETPTTTPSLPLNYPTCPFFSDRQSYIPDPDWKLDSYGGYEYALYTLKRNFTEAEASCAYYGAHLVSILDEHVEKFALGMAQDTTVWVGGIVTGEESFCWTDGRESNFNLGISMDKRSCIGCSQSYGCFNGNCEDALGFICKRLPPN